MIFKIQARIRMSSKTKDSEGKEISLTQRTSQVMRHVRYKWSTLNITKIYKYLVILNMQKLIIQQLSVESAKSDKIAKKKCNEI